MSLMLLVVNSWYWQSLDETIDKMLGIGPVVHQLVEVIVAMAVIILIGVVDGIVVVVTVVVPVMEAKMEEAMQIGSAYVTMNG